MVAFGLSNFSFLKVEKLTYNLSLGPVVVLLV
jgi:hypothetical protein